MAGESLCVHPEELTQAVAMVFGVALTQISRDIFIVAVHPSLPVKSVKELVALAKARPGDFAA